MPIYEYQCKDCGHEFEEWQKITDPPTQICPSCGAKSVERLVSLSAFHLKGSGWYVTDYGGKKSGTEPAKSKDSKTPSTSSTGDSSKTDSSSSTSSTKSDK